MGGTASTSKVTGVSEQNDPLWLCGQRKDALELAIKRRSLFVDALCKYNRSLYEVAIALRIANVHSQTKDCSSSDSISSMSSAKVNREKVGEETRHLKEEEGNVETQRRSGDESSEKREGNLSDYDVGQGRELVEALKDVEEYFIKAYESGLEVSKMLDANMDQIQSSVEEIEEKSNKLERSLTTRNHPNKLMRSLPLKRSTSYRCSSKSVHKSSSRASSKYYFNSGISEGNGAKTFMGHSFTLRELHEQVKILHKTMMATEESRKELKELQKEKKREGVLKGTRDSTGAGIAKLEARIKVFEKEEEVQYSEIHRLTDKEMKPQLVALFHCLMRNMRIVSEYHDAQTRIMKTVKVPDGVFCSDSHQLTTYSKLEAEIPKWCACFTSYVSSLKAYVESLNDGLFKFAAANNDKPSLYHHWLVCLNKLPYKDVTSAMTEFGNDVRELMIQQGEEHKLQKTVDKLSRKIHENSKKEHLKKKVDEGKKEQLIEEKRQVEKKLKAEKLKTRHFAESGFQEGFSKVFEYLANYSSGATEMYDGLIAFDGDACVGIDDESNSNSSEHVTGNFI
ncbi:hypothetical protein ACFX13_004668 [Malus domestica]|uniref:protein ALTERED PHOSPHATE STARVATION RESPONSE 1-like n=1 Tax=Malus domestica TaxID=3750 RepID=UPI00049909BC|nr:nitrate regulatory gene2 protein-like [Malus domestica]XP_050104835.1 protein ALTERED PHOSPHATE STARVATION RESPONSE 1-like [Malus sylvestris]